MRHIENTRLYGFVREKDRAFLFNVELSGRRHVASGGPEDQLAPERFERAAHAAHCPPPGGIGKEKRRPAGAGRTDQQEGKGFPLRIGRGQNHLGVFFRFAVVRRFFAQAFEIEYRLERGKFVPDLFRPSSFARKTRQIMRALPFGGGGAQRGSCESRFGVLPVERVTEPDRRLRGQEGESGNLIFGDRTESGQEDDPRAACDLFFEEFPLFIIKVVRVNVADDDDTVLPVFIGPLAAGEPDVVDADFLFRVERHADELVLEPAGPFQKENAQISPQKKDIRVGGVVRRGDFAGHDAGRNGQPFLARLVRRVGEPERNNLAFGRDGDLLPRDFGPLGGKGEGDRLAAAARGAQKSFDRYLVPEIGACRNCGERNGNIAQVRLVFRTYGARADRDPRRACRKRGVLGRDEVGRALGAVRDEENA